MMSSNVERDPVEALAAEFMERQRRGERPTIEEYTRQHPELAEEIRELFPTIVALETWKLDKVACCPRPQATQTGPLTYLGDYRLIREIARGGMGIVYEAEQESLGRHVAVKVLPRGPLLADKQLRRFEREAKTAAKLHHTNIVPVFGVGEQDGLHYYVMQFIRGVGLNAVVEALRQGQAAAASASNGAAPSSSFTPRQAADALRSGSFAGVARDRSQPVEPAAPPLAEAQHAQPVPFSKAYWKGVADLGRQVANALDYAHSQNVLHRDIKPANLLLDATGTVWVADFGLAKVLERDGISTTGDIVGTLQYMAPEQFQGHYDARGDICGLGLTLYELLTLRPAFQDDNRSRLIRRITEEEPPSPRTLNRAIPRDLETIVLKASARDPGRRYRTAKELHDDFERFLEDRPIQARRIGQAQRLGRWCRRNPAVAGLTVLAVSLLALVAAVATAGYARMRDALEGETQQRQRAEAISKEETQQRQRAEAISKEEAQQRRRAEEISKEEAQQRHRAEATAGLSLEVLEEIFERLAPDRVAAASQLTVASAGGEAIEVALQPTLSPETAALLEKLLVFYDRLAAQGNDESKVRRQAARANRRVGDIQLLLGQTEHALEAYRRAESLYRELTKQFPEKVTLMTELAGVYNALGQAHRKNNQPDKGKAAHWTAIQILTAPAASRATAEKIHYELARTYFYLGRTSFEPQKPPPPKKSGGPPPRPPVRTDAVHYLGKAAGLLKDLVQEQPAVPAYRHLLALCCREKSTLVVRIDWNDRKESIGLLEQLVKQFPQVPEYRFDLSETLAQLDVRGAFVPAPGAAAVDKDLQEALRLSRQLVAQHPNVPDYQFSKAQIQHQLGLVQQHDRQLDKAENHLRQSVELQNSLVQRFPKVLSYRFMKFRFQEALIHVLLEQKKWKPSHPLLESSALELKKMIGQDEKLKFLTFGLAEHYGKLGKILCESEEPELAAVAEQQARELRQGMPKGPPGPGKGDKKGPPKKQ